MVTVARAEAPVESTTVIVTGVFAATHREPLVPVVTVSWSGNRESSRAISELNAVNRTGCPVNESVIG